MRRIVIRLLGALELVAGIVLLVFAYQLPGPSDVSRAAERFEQVGRKAGKQVRNLRDQLEQVRKRQPELLVQARRMQKQMESIRTTIEDRTFSADGLETVGDAMGQVAMGLDSLATTLDVKGVEQVGKGFGTTADFLDGKIVPAAEKAATALDKASAGLKGDAGKLSAILKETPLDLKAARAVVESLTKVEEGLERMTGLFKADNMTAIREGFKGMQSSLDGGATQVDRFSGMTIPKVTVKGFRISVEEKDFWPDGKDISTGMRKAAKGCEAAGKELDAINKDLPRIRTSLDQSRKVVSATREALAGALQRQEKLDPVLQRLPQHLARLADDLPQLTAELAKMLRETSRLKEVATALRQAEKGISVASGRWPELRQGLEKSAGILRNTQKQLQGALTNRDEYEKTLEQTVELSTLFARSLPALLEQMESGLQQQDQSLGELSESIEGVSDSVPAAAEVIMRILSTARLLLGLVGLIVLLHGAYLAFAGTGREGSG